MYLRAFVDLLDQRRLLVRVTKPVDVQHEISSVVKVLRGRPVLFEDVKGYDMPVISNVCSTRDQACLGLGVDKKDLLARLASAVERPREPATAPAHDYEEVDPDLGRLPVLTYYPADGGPYIASGIAIGRDPEYGINASYHRAMVTGDRELVLRIVERHFHAFIERGLTEFAFCIGSPISVLIAAAVSVEIGKNELAIANALRETPLVELGGHLVPPSDIVMICELTGERASEGPFLDLTETFDIVRQQPVARVQRVFTRPAALFHALLPGDLEHKVLMGMPREPTIFHEVDKVVDCLDVHITPGGCCWLHGAVKIRKKQEDDGKRAIEAAFRGHPSMKHVFVVDEDIDIEDPAAMEWAMASRFQGDRDLVIKTGQKGSSLDPSSDQRTRETTKVGFDLTIPSKERTDEFRRAEPPMAIRLEDYL